VRIDAVENECGQASSGIKKLSKVIRGWKMPGEKYPEKVISSKIPKGILKILFHRRLRCAALELRCLAGVEDGHDIQGECDWQATSASHNTVTNLTE
jgi:hypothetical protein